MIVDGNLLRDHHGDIIATLPRDMNPNDLCEIKRRVNGWDKLVAFVRSVEQQECYCCDSGDTVNTCDACRARVALREASCE